MGSTFDPEHSLNGDGHTGRHNSANNHAAPAPMTTPTKLLLNHTSLEEAKLESYEEI